MLLMNKLYRHFFCVALVVLLWMPPVQAEIYHCMIEGNSVFTDHECGPDQMKLSAPEVVSKGLTVFPQSLSKSLEVLTKHREQDQLSNQLDQAQRQLSLMSDHFIQSTHNYQAQLEGLSDQPAYRNWQTNAVRAKKLRKHKRQLQDERNQAQTHYKAQARLIESKISSLESQLGE